MRRLYRKIIRLTGSHTRRLAIALLAITLVLSLIYHVFEVEIQPGIEQSYFRSLMDIFILLLSGFDLERQPVTGVGWATAILLLVTNLLFIGAVIQGMGEIIMKAQGRRISGMQKAHFTDHTVIFGLTSQSRRIIDLYLGNIDRYRTRLVLVDERLEALPVAYVSESDAIEFVKGNPFDDDTLRRARLGRAGAAIICPQDEGPASQADSYAILIALAVERFNPDVVSTLILRDRSSRLFLERNTNNGKIQVSVDQVICPDEIVDGLAASAALNPGLSAFVLDVLTYSDDEGGGGDAADDNLIVVDPFPDSLFEDADWRARAIDFPTLVNRFLEVEGGLLLGLSGNAGFDVLPGGQVVVEDRMALVLRKESLGRH